jgi:RNA polymerase sigma-70 factor (ECF subfamily)
MAPGETGVNEAEANLVSRCLAGDEAARAALYRSHAARIAAYLRRCGFAAADVDDLRQETFARAFRSLAGFDASRGALGAWLGQIARNVARRRWGRRDEPRHFDPEMAEEVLAATGNPGTEAADREEVRLLGQCVAALPVELAQVVHLRYVEARTTRGIAAAIGMPESTVRLRLTEAMGLLERDLRARGLTA